jgi:hypothetical protein
MLDQRRWPACQFGSAGPTPPTLGGLPSNVRSPFGRQLFRPVPAPRAPQAAKLDRGRGFLVSSASGAASPVASSTMAFARAFGSLVRLRDRSGTGSPNRERQDAKRPPEGGRLARDAIPSGVHPESYQGRQAPLISGGVPWNG